MGRALTIVAVLAIIGGAVYFALFRGAGPGDTPGVGEVLSAQHTAGVAGVQSLDELARMAESVAKGVPAEQAGPMADFLDAAKRTEKLGFDPVDAKSWAALGIDPKAGVHFAVDGRVVGNGQPLPLLLLRITDQAKLLAFIEKHAGQKPEVSGDGPVKTLKMAGATHYFGERKGFTVLLLGNERDAGGGAKKGFEALLADGGESMASTGVFSTAFGGAKAPLVYGYGDLRGARSIAAELKMPPTVLGVIDYYVGLFPGVAMWVGENSAGFRLVASEKGAALLRKFFRPQRKAPEFAHYVPKAGWGAAKFSVNLPQFFDAVAEALPPDIPEMTQVKQGMQMATLAMPMAIGVSWQQIGQAFSGHAAVAVDLGSLSKFPLGFDGVVMLGVADGEVADTVAKTLLGKAKEMLPIPLVAKRHDEVMLVGTQASVDAAIARSSGKDTLKGTPLAKAMGDDVVYSAFYDLGPYLDMLGSTSPEMKPILDVPAVKKLRGSAVGGALRLDRHGLVAEGVGDLQMSTMMGVWAAIAIPAFTKYIARSKTAEATMHVRKMYDQAVAYYEQERTGPDGALLPKRFPPTTALTPSDPCRKRGKPELTPASAWAAPGWQALNFQIEDPSYYSYEFVSSGEGESAAFTARAIGDLDCDGVRSTFERIGTIRDGMVTGAAGLFRNNETE